MLTEGVVQYTKKLTASFSAERHKLLSDMLLLWCSWFMYRLIKLDLVTVGKLVSK